MILSLQAPAEDGSPPGASPGQQQVDLLQQLLDCEAELQSANAELQTLRMQQASDMEEVRALII